MNDEEVKRDRKPKLLVLADSPTTKTGFARVARELVSRAPFDIQDIDWWAVNFDGTGYQGVPWHLIPASLGGQVWYREAMMTRFLARLRDGDYTDVWMLGDVDAFCQTRFPEALQKVCREKGVRSRLYFPVDAPLEPEWTEIVARVDDPVAYTHYARLQVEIANRTDGTDGTDENAERGARSAEQPAHGPRPPATQRIRVLPHGVDAAFFRPCPDAATRERARAALRVESPDGTVTPFAGPEDLLILSVNKNEWRKDPLRLLEIVAGLRAGNVPAKLVLRCAPTSNLCGVDILKVAPRLGLTVGEDVFLVPAVTEEELRHLYWACDLYMTTTLGEGWGLGITEALACGKRVAMPLNTSCMEIGEEIGRMGLAGRICWLPAEAGHVCGHDGRLRQRCDLEMGVTAVASELQGGPKPDVPLPQAAKHWLDWDRIAGEMWRGKAEG